jgi:hypothetical protein
LKAGWFVVELQKIFRDRADDSSFPDNPCTIPFGGNALAVLNLEARILVTNAVPAATFQEGGQLDR